MSISNIQEEANHIEKWLQDHVMVNAVFELEYRYGILKKFIGLLFSYDFEVHKKAAKSGNHKELNRWNRQLDMYLKLVLDLLQNIEKEAKRLDAYNIDNPSITVNDINATRNRILFSLNSNDFYKGGQFDKIIKDGERERKRGEFTEG